MGADSGTGKLADHAQVLRDYQKQFIAFALAQGAIRFGEFRLKSGRTSPWFFNAGCFGSGDALARLGGFYADALLASGLPCDCLFGPAYKGIPLVSATAIALADRDKALPYLFNRKEAKEHGEGGSLVGGEPAGNLVIVDDVITAGTAVREVMPLLAATAAKPVGLLIAVDRQEKGQGALSAVQEVEREFGLQVAPIITLSHLVEHLDAAGGHGKEVAAIQRYQEKHGIAQAAQRVQGRAPLPKTA